MQTPEVKIGKVKIGGKNPIAIQSMTNTDTASVNATVKQIVELADAGSELVRFTVDNDAAALAVPKIRKQLDKKGYKNLPLIGDFHFNGHRLLSDYPDCAKALDKYRINPGNVGYGKSHDENFETIIKLAIKNKKAIRIGGNAGSIDPEVFNKLSKTGDSDVLIKALVKSVIDSAKLAEKLGLKRDRIVLSVKMSDVGDLIKAHELLVKKMRGRNYALHIGLTEAGGDLNGVVSSVGAISILLSKGIGDTLRVSLTPAPGASRSKEVEVCKLLLQSLGYRYFFPRITSCPGCGRANNQLLQRIAKKTQEFMNKNFEQLHKKHPKLAKLKIAVMGCVVNGPGESRGADIAISLPGKNEKNMAQIYINGKLESTIQSGNMADEFIKILKNYIKQNC